MSDLISSFSALRYPLVRSGVTIQSTKPPTEKESVVKTQRGRTKNKLLEDQLFKSQCAKLFLSLGISTGIGLLMGCVTHRLIETKALKFFREMKHGNVAVEQLGEAEKQKITDYITCWESFSKNSFGWLKQKPPVPVVSDKHIERWLKPEDSQAKLFAWEFGGIAFLALLPWSLYSDIEKKRKESIKA
jgi:hypothetical protein